MLCLNSLTKGPASLNPAPAREAKNYHQKWLAEVLFKSEKWFNLVLPPIFQKKSKENKKSQNSIPMGQLVRRECQN